MMEGVIASSDALGDKFYIDLVKLLPLQRFLPQLKGQAQNGDGGQGHCDGGCGGCGGRGGEGGRGRGDPSTRRDGRDFHRGGGHGGGFRGHGR